MLSSFLETKKMATKKEINFFKQCLSEKLKNWKLEIKTFIELLEFKVIFIPEDSSEEKERHDIAIYCSPSYEKSKQYNFLPLRKTIGKNHFSENCNTDFSFRNEVIVLYYFNLEGNPVAKKIRTLNKEDKPFSKLFIYNLLLGEKNCRPCKAPGLFSSGGKFYSCRHCQLSQCSDCVNKFLIKIQGDKNLPVKYIATGLNENQKIFSLRCRYCNITCAFDVNLN